MNWPRRHRKSPEHRLAVAVAQFLNLALPHDSCWSTTPTAGSSIAQGARIKAAGYLAGWPDLQIIWQGRSYFIELKAPKGVMSDEQRAVQTKLMRAGCYIGSAKSVDDVQDWLLRWAIPLRQRLQPRAVELARMT